MKKSIPNIITLLNLFLACWAIVALFNLNYNLAIILFGFSLLADFADGLAARLLNATSALGKELDSLADMVAFGFFPGVLLYDLLKRNFEPDQYFPALLPAFIVTLFSALRLARFNLDERQVSTFIGLPTPGSACFTLGLFMLVHFDRLHLGPYLGHSISLYTFIIILSYLLIAEIPMFSLKFRALAWKGNEIRFIFIALSIVTVVLLKEAALFFILVLYLLLSMIQFLSQGKTINS